MADYAIIEKLENKSKELTFLWNIPRSQLFKEWRTQLFPLILILWIAIYPVDNTIRLLNNPGERYSWIYNPRDDQCLFPFFTQFLSFNFNHQINTLTGFNVGIPLGKQRTIFCPEILGMILVIKMSCDWLMFFYRRTSTYQK